MFNDFYAIQNLDHPGQLEAEEAEVSNEALFVDIFPKNFYLSLEKKNHIDAHSSFEVHLSLLAGNKIVIIVECSIEKSSLIQLSLSA